MQSAPPFPWAANRTLAALLVAVLWSDSLAAKPFGPRAKDASSDINTLRNQIAALNSGTPIEVRLLIAKEKLRGKLGKVDADGFVLQGRDPAASGRRVRFDQIKSLKVLPGKRSTIAGWIIAGALIGVVVVALVIYLEVRHNE